MRRLLYVPVLHDEADIGSAGAALQQRSSSMAGEERWAKHRETACRFWESVFTYLSTFADHGLKVYQDGLPADGETGRRIVAEAAARGSKNYRVVQRLLDLGAELCKTEDPALLLQEHQGLLALVSGRGSGDAELSPVEYSTQRDLLTEARDRYIAETIGATLAEDEAGVLFIGAYHRVAQYLAADISCHEVKEREAVLAYVENLLVGHDDEGLAELGQYLASPISLPPF